MGLFKTGDELYNLAMESINRREYDRAKELLVKAIDRNTTKQNLAVATISFLNMANSLNVAASYRHLRDSLINIDGEEFNIGLTTFSKTNLIKECDAMIAQLNAISKPVNSEELMVAKAQAMIEAAKIIQINIGQEPLRIQEYFTKNVQSGQKIATTMLAEANELLADAVVHHDTKKAAEYQQIAFNFRRQLGESGEKNQALINRYIASCTCWFCGRVAVGDGINFVKMGCDMIPNEENEDITKSADEEKRVIFVCRSCYTAFSRRADDISRGYYNESIKEMREMETRINMKIAALEAQIGAVAWSSRR